MDNPQFSVNGKIKDRESLLQLLKIRCKQDGFEDYSRSIEGYSISPKYGLVLYWAKPDTSPDGFVPFPSKLTPEAVMPIINAFLDDDTLQNEVDKMDEMYTNDSDVDNSRGWRIYCNDWGHIGDWSAFVAIKKVWLWYGK